MNIELDPAKIIEQAATRLADEAYESVDALGMLEAEISRRIDAFLGDCILDKPMLKPYL